MTTVQLNTAFTTSVHSQAQDFTPEDQFKNDLEELQTILDYLRTNPGDAEDSHVQNITYNFLEQFAKDFNQLPEAERKSPQMDLLVRELNEAGLISGDTNGISVVSMPFFGSNLYKLAEGSGSSPDWITGYIDPAIKAAEASLK